MTSQQLGSYIIMGLGVIVFLAGLPIVQGRVIRPMQNFGVLPKIKELKRKDRVLITGIGPNMSLMVTGAALFLAGVIMLLSSK